MHSDEDLEPRNKSPVAHPQPQTMRQYLWMDCDVRGWQVLVANTADSVVIPKPPDCVLKSRTTPRPISPTRKLLSPASPHSLIESPGLLDVDDEPSDSLPKKNFVLANIRNTSSPKRHTRSALLEKAANQLRETELVSASLAERLNLIQNRLNG